MGMFRHGRVQHKRETVRGRPGSHCHPDPFGKAQGQLQRRLSWSRHIVHLGTDPSPWSQDDRSVEVYCRHIFDTR